MSIKSTLFLKKFVFLGLCYLVVSCLSGCNYIQKFGLSKKVLFIGNSYTTTALIPNVFKELAESGGYSVEVGMAADKGGDFVSYAFSPAIRDALQSSKWDFVILQEQTQIPSSPYIRASKMYPAARKLVQQIRSIGATPVFFQTSGNRNGWPEGGLPSYEGMQLEIIKGYSKIAGELNVPVAPVGHAWSVAMDNIPQLNLWLDDRHPNGQGAYLAACVFYATLFRESPEGAKYKANLSRDLATELQGIAADSVLQNLHEWNL